MTVRDELLNYYERELAYLRRMGAEFAEKYPKVAGRLLLEPSKSEDPHVERLLEAFAFIAARIHLKLDDEFSLVSEALLDVLYPHALRPTPAMSLVEFHLDPTLGKLPAGARVPRDASLYSRPVGGVPCRFRACYDTTLWPVSVAAAEWLTPDRLRPSVRAPDAVAAIRLELRCFAGLTFSQLKLDSLRLHLSADAALASTLYELLANNCVRILMREPAAPGAPAGKSLTLDPASVLRPVGFEADEGMLPFAGRTFLGYRLLQEYFTFPDKFLFFDLSGFDQARAAGFGQQMEVVFLLSPFERTERRPMLESGVAARTFRLGCTPVVNLFKQTSEPILLDQRQPEYLIVPDARRRLTTEVFSVDEVVGMTPGAAEPLRFEPFHVHRRTREGAGPAGAYWQATRRPSGWRTDAGTDVHLSLVDLTGRSVHPDLDVVTARLTCYNGDLPSRLPFGDESGDFELEGGGPFARIVALVKPTPVLQPPLGRPLLWRLVSQLSLNYLSLVDGGPEALQETLRLHNAGDSPIGELHIRGIRALRSAPTFARVASEQGVAFARGRRVEIDFDEEEFAGGGVYLFASIIERFLGMSVSLNSFSALTARTRQRKQPVRQWPPRSGWKNLL